MPARLVAFLDMCAMLGSRLKVKERFLGRPLPTRLRDGLEGLCWVSCVSVLASGSVKVAEPLGRARGSVSKVAGSSGCPQVGCSRSSRGGGETGLERSF